MKHGKHILSCAAFAAAAIALVSVGAGALAFLPVLGCALMMGMMIWMMTRPDGHGRGGDA